MPEEALETPNPSPHQRLSKICSGHLQILISGGGNFQKFHELKSSCNQFSKKQNPPIIREVKNQKYAVFHKKLTRPENYKTKFLCREDGACKLLKLTSNSLISKT